MKLRIAALICNWTMGVIVFFNWGRMVFQRTDSGRLSAAGLHTLKYFTVLSNLLLGIAAFVYALCVLRILLGKAAGIPCTVYQLKYAATVSVGLTFLTVMLFLGPRFGYGAMFQGVNLWFHLLIPLTAIASFWLLEPDGTLSLQDSMLAVLPMLLYAIGYIISFCANYFLSARFTFKSHTTKKNGVGFAAAHVFNFFLQLGLLNFFIWLGVPKEWAPFPMYCIAVPSNFIIVRTVFSRWN